MHACVCQTVSRGTFTFFFYFFYFHDTKQRAHLPDQSLASTLWIIVTRSSRSFYDRTTLVVSISFFFVFFQTKIPSVHHPKRSIRLKTDSLIYIWSAYRFPPMSQHPARNLEEKSLKVVLGFNWKATLHSRPLMNINLPPPPVLHKNKRKSLNFSAHFLGFDI